MRITVRVTPRASRRELSREPDGSFTAAVVEPPVGGKATDAVRRLLAEHFDIAPSRVQLLMGHASRVKVFEIL